ncbi:InlB B-repeat-containing protein [Streptomyces sp. NBC_01264]|uniref:InlB B-repeat-containing protein n=1 Tax=Streptomyces sp. NBC_01264 TaxID=2903804 RepID=UPI002255C7A6|nr:zinc-dependent metalloprotease family protein [Streptomyces sp. NBC_01264]MCX4775339.1 hypothetical protein [Streptomyces sp. NBC_01264]
MRPSFTGDSSTSVVATPQASSGNSDVSGFGVHNLFQFMTETLAHEIGHNFGLFHDTVNAQRNPSYPDNRGFLPADRTWVDVMGYKNTCASASRCTVQQWYSNPRQSFNNAPRGAALPREDAADAGRVMNLTGPVLSQYRTRPGAAPEGVALSAVSSDVATGTVIAEGGGGLFLAGTKVKITATPAAGYRLSRIVVDGGMAANPPSVFQLELKGSCHLTAYFDKV